SRSRHTRCYRDWSSDVCSSDLFSRLLAYLWRALQITGWRGARGQPKRAEEVSSHARQNEQAALIGPFRGDPNRAQSRQGVLRTEIGRASCRARVQRTAVATVA